MSEILTRQSLGGKRPHGAPPNQNEFRVRHELFDAFAATGLALHSSDDPAEDIRKEHVERFKEVIASCKAKFGIEATNAALKSYGLEKFVG